MEATHKKNVYSANEESFKENIFRESFVFVLDLIQFSEQLNQKKKKSLAKQLIKTGTTFGEIINELKFIEKKEIYFSKIKEIYKNAHFTKYLLQLCLYSPAYPKPNNLIADLDKLIEQLARIIKENRNKIKYKV